MIDITGLREDKRPQSSTIVHALLDRLEAAEAEALEQARLNGMGSEREAALMAKLEAAERERDECNRRRLEAADHFAAQTALMKKKYDDLRVKVAEMEKQEPVAWTVRGVAEWVSNGDGTYSLGGCLEAVAPLPDDTQLYALPGAQPAPSLASGDVSRISGGKTQPAPSVPKLHVGNLPTVNQDAYPALGAWWVQLWDGDSVFARVYGASPEEASSRAAMLAAVPEAK